MSFAAQTYPRSSAGKMRQRLPGPATRSSHNLCDGQETQGRDWRPPSRQAEGVAPCCKERCISSTVLARWGTRAQIAASLLRYDSTTSFSRALRPFRKVMISVRRSQLGCHARTLPNSALSRTAALPPTPCEIVPAGAGALPGLSALNVARQQMRAGVQRPVVPCSLAPLQRWIGVRARGVARLLACAKARNLSPT